MAYTSEQYEKLKSAIALGATTVKYADKEITYRTLSDMKNILEMMEADIEPPKTRRKYVEFDKGL